MTLLLRHGGTGTPVTVVVPPTPAPDPDARPTVPAVTEYWYNELKVTQPGDEHRDWPLLKLLGAMGTTFGRLFDVVTDSDAGPGWSMLLDPARAPSWALPWLAQFAGVTLADGASDSEQRARITSPPSFLRGTPVAMRAAVQNTLTGTKAVTILENVGSDPYAMTVVVRSDEAPDPQTTTDAAQSQKPLGMVLTVLFSNATPIDALTGSVDALTGTVDAL